MYTYAAKQSSFIKIYKSISFHIYPSSSTFIILYWIIFFCIRKICSWKKNNFFNISVYKSEKNLKISLFVYFFFTKPTGKLFNLITKENSRVNFLQRQVQTVYVKMFKVSFLSFEKNILLIIFTFLKISLEIISNLWFLYSHSFNSIM